MATFFTLTSNKGRYKMIRLTKKEAVKMFMDTYGEGLFSHDSTGRKMDKAANREMWNNWTDMLCKDGKITQYQFDTWTYPRNKFFH